MEIKKVALRGGHNFQAVGAEGLLKEVVEDRIIYGHAIDYLRLEGVEVLDVTPPNCGTNEDLAYGVNKANEWGADIFASVHLNKAYASYAGPIGTEVICGKEFKEAVEVCNRISTLGFINRGLKFKPGYYEIRNTNMKAMIIETLFCESVEDVALYKTVGAEAIGKAIAEGILGKEIIKVAPSKCNITYDTHLENIGWQGTKSNGETAGTVGESRRLEAITINYDGQGRLEFQAHLAFTGWQGVRNSGEVAGTIGKSKRIEAIKINLRDTDKTIKYRAHVEGIGWQEWVKNGEVAGTVGKSLRLEAIEIKVE